MAGLDKLQRVGGEERLIHRHRRPVRRDPFGAAPQPFDIGENIVPAAAIEADGILARSEEHTSELPSLMRTSYAVLCLKKKKSTRPNTSHEYATSILSSA